MKRLLLLLCCIYSHFGQAQSPKEPLQTLRREAAAIGKSMANGAAVADEKVRQRLIVLHQQAVAAGSVEDEMQILNLLANEYFIMGQLRESAQVQQKLILLAKKHDDSLSVSSHLMDLGRLYFNEEKFSAALNLYMEALRLRERYGARKSSIALVYTHIGRVYAQLNDLQAAEKYLQKAYQIKAEAKDTIALGMIHVSMAEVYRRAKKYELAEKNFQRDIPKRLQNNNLEGVMECYRGLTDLYTDWKKYDQAVYFCEQNLRLARQLNRKRVEGRLMLRLANLYEKQNNPQKANELYQKMGLKVGQIHSLPLQRDTYQKLSTLNARAGNFEAAYQYLQRVNALNDSIMDENSQKLLSELRAKFEVEQKEHEIAELDRQNKAQEQQRKLLLLGIATLSLLALGVIYLNISRRKAFQKLAQEQRQTQQLLTEKEQLLQNLHHTQLHLVQSEKMASLGLLTAGVAHELNNPIGYINASVSALKMDFLELNPVRIKLLALEQSQNLTQDVQAILDDLEKMDATYLFEEMGKLMQSIENGTQRTTEIVAGLRTFSRDTGDAYLPAYLHEGIDSALTLLNHKRNEKLLIHKNYGDLPPVSCQFSKINQVFLNLLDNAIQAVGEAGEIFIQTWQEGQFACVAIRDTGKGMDEATQKRVFEPFFTTKEVGKGTGLGLSISYAIVQQHRGSIEVSSQPNVGTTFTIKLPIAQTN
ncbi:MAG: ATP-binding protein [Spirosomaceae bacterium]|jgi:signal transduction histidine kinase|nr:ATP-binding protein [Spirosomataceae bacterium]